MNNTTMQNFMYILIEQCKIFGIGLLVATPFAFIFFPISIFIMSIAGIAGWIALFVAGFKIMNGTPLDTPMNSPSQKDLSPEEWLEMRKTQDAYNDERKEKRNSKIKDTLAVIMPPVKRLFKLVMIAGGSLFLLMFVISVVSIISEM